MYPGQWTPFRRRHSFANPARERLHKHTQLCLHDLLMTDSKSMTTFQDLCPAVTSNYEDPKKYNDLALQDADGRPYCRMATVRIFFKLSRITVRHRTISQP